MYSPEPSVFSIGGMDQVPGGCQATRACCCCSAPSLRRCQDKPRFELSNMGLPSTSTNCPELGCYAGYRSSQTGHKSQGQPDQVVPLVPSCCCLMVLCYAAIFLGLACSPRDPVLLPSFFRNREMQWVTSKCCMYCGGLSLNRSGGVQIQDPVSVLFLNLRCQGRDVYSRIMWTSDLGRRMHRHQRDEREAHKLHDQGAATNLRPTRPRSIEELACCVTAQHWALAPFRTCHIPECYVLHEPLC